MERYLETKRLLLVPPYGQIVEQLHYLLSTGDAAYRWRFRGGTPSPAAYASQLWEGITAQYVALDRLSGEPQSYVGIYNANFISGTAFCFAIDLRSDKEADSIGAEGLLALLFHAFSSWDFRKVYFELPVFNLDSASVAVRRHLVEEGRLVDHEHFLGRYWDSLVLALYRERWVELAARFRPVIYGTGES